MTRWAERHKWWLAAIFAVAVAILIGSLVDWEDIVQS